MPNMHEFTFSVDDFENPKVLKDGEAIATLLTRLLLLEPGTIQSHPDMGVGINSRYKYAIEGEGSKLENDFKAQIKKYLPKFEDAIVKVNEKDGCYFISVQIDSSMYGIYYDKTTSQLRSNYTSLSTL